MIKVRFESPSRDEIGPTCGPFDWVQVTYELLRIAPDGDPFAVFTGKGWYLLGTEYAPVPWSDMIISTFE